MSDAPTYPLDNLWSRDALSEVRVGDVVDATGRALDVQKLIMRRWGWPKLAAKRSAEWLEEKFGAGEGYMLPIMGPARTHVQRKLLDALPGLLDDLMEGISNRAHREVKDAHRAVTSVEVAFVQDSAAGRVPAAIPDEGLITSIASTVAGRLGISLDEFRERADFQHSGAVVRVTVFVDVGD